MGHILSDHQTITNYPFIQRVKSTSTMLIIQSLSVVLLALQLLETLAQGGPCTCFCSSVGSPENNLFRNVGRDVAQDPPLLPGPSSESCTCFCPKPLEAFTFVPIERFQTSPSTAAPSISTAPSSMPSLSQQPSISQMPSYFLVHPAVCSGSGKPCTVDTDEFAPCCGSLICSLVDNDGTRACTADSSAGGLDDFADLSIPSGLDLNSCSTRGDACSLDASSEFPPCCDNLTCILSNPDGSRVCDNTSNGGRDDFDDLKLSNGPQTGCNRGDTNCRGPICSTRGDACSLDASSELPPCCDNLTCILSNPDGSRVCDNTSNGGRDDFDDLKLSNGARPPVPGNRRKTRRVRSRDTVRGLKVQY